MQAVLPSLSQRYGVGPAAMGLAVNASTLGMAVSSLATSFLSQHIDRRWGVVISLALLAVPAFAATADASDTEAAADAAYSGEICALRIDSWSLRVQKSYNTPSKKNPPVNR